MFFPAGISKDAIMGWCESQIAAVASASKHGVDIEIKPHKKRRTLEQNSFWWKIMDHIHEFTESTGWKPKGLENCTYCSSELLHCFFKAVYGIHSTKKLDTKAFYELTNKLQNDMVQTTKGEYESIIPPDRYAESLTKGY